ncbi:MAG: RHS repeat domain-containing protein [Planctomycetota bacterium]
MSSQKFYHDANVGINEPNLVITTIYDKLGRRVRVDINDIDNETLARWRWWYDDQGRVKTILALDHFVAYEYHGNTGRQKSVRTPQQEADTKVNYYYDRLGRLGEVNLAKRNNVPVNESTYYGYNPVGSLAIVDYNNGNVAEYTYDALNRLTNLTNWQSSAKQTPLSRYQYTLSPDGQRTKAIETTAAGSTEITWTYDDLNRLIAEDYNAPGDANDYGHKYVYDMVGNRLERNVVGSDPNTTYHYNDNDQLTWETTDGNTITYGYDDNGALVLRDANSGDDVTYSYDLRGRLAQADIENGPTVDYLYNPDGVRVRATVDGNDIDYIIDPYNHTGYAQVLKEINGVTGTNRVYVTGLDVVAQATGSNSPKYLLYDGHGSVRQLANNVGNIVANYHYDAYGQALNLNPAQAATQLLYAGEMIDPQTGWYNDRSRWYNPAIGRFNRMDEFAGTCPDPQSLHKYLYTHCNPVNRIDPRGLFSVMEILAVSGIVGLVMTGIRLGMGYLEYRMYEPRVLGTMIHEAIFWWYRGQKFKCNNWIATSDNPPLNRYRPDCRCHERGPFWGEVYEIKPIGRITEGEQQVEDYIDDLRVWHPGIDWHRGQNLLCPTVLPKWQLPLEFLRVHVSLPLPGVIAYKVHPDYKEAVKFGIVAAALTATILMVNGFLAGYGAGTGAGPNVIPFPSQPWPVPLPAAA